MNRADTQKRFEEEYLDKIFGFCCQKTNSKADAEVMSRVMRKIDFGIWQKSITGGGLTAPWLLFSRQGAKGQGRRYAARLALDAL